MLLKYVPTPPHGSVWRFRAKRATSSGDSSWRFAMVLAADARQVSFWCPFRRGAAHFKPKPRFFARTMRQQPLHHMTSKPALESSRTTLPDRARRSFSDIVFVLLARFIARFGLLRGARASQHFRHDTSFGFRKVHEPYCLMLRGMSIDMTIDKKS